MTPLDLPQGSLTFLFTDIEGSTRLLQDLGSGYAAVQDNHALLMRQAISEAGGTEVRTVGDAFFAVFSSALGAVRAATSAQRAFATRPWPACRAAPGPHGDAHGSGDARG